MVDAPLDMLHPVPSDPEIQPVREVFLGMGEEIRAGGESLNERVPNKTVLPRGTHSSHTVAFILVPPGP